MNYYVPQPHDDRMSAVDLGGHDAVVGNHVEQHVDLAEVGVLGHVKVAVSQAAVAHGRVIGTDLPVSFISRSVYCSLMMSFVTSNALLDQACVILE